MSTAVAYLETPNLQSDADAVSPGRIGFDPFGLVSGFRAYRIFTALDRKTDWELAALGITRAEAPRAAFQAAEMATAA